jgi:hypothetical protein
MWRKMLLVLLRRRFFLMTVSFELSKWFDMFNFAQGLVLLSAPATE